MPKKKDALIIIAVLAVAALMLVVSRLMPKTNLEEKVAQSTMAPDAIEYIDATAEPVIEPTAEPVIEPTAEPVIEPTAEPAIEPAIEPTAEPKAEPQAAAFGPMPPKQTEAVKGHVVLTVNGRQYGDPIPMDREKVITIKQEDGKVNKVHITPERVYMESSSCDNQDCVGQGEISIDNYKTRVLSTFVICLPNEVTIEMVPVE